MFTVAKENGQEAVDVLHSSIEALADKVIKCGTNVAKISVVGAGMETHPGVASKMFEALFERDINIQMISTSEIKISVLIDADLADKAVAAVHDKFIDD